jgi:micrococcal nuclease
MIKIPKKLNQSKLLTAGIGLITLIIGFFGGNYYNQYKQSQLLTSGTVTRIIDADTVELNGKISVRLNGVSCPEKGEKFSKEAIDYLTQTALNQLATLDYQPNYATDAWNRTVAFVFINDTHLNEQLIRNGYCTATIYKKRAKLKYQDELIQAQEEAKQEKLGKWN